MGEVALLTLPDPLDGWDGLSLRDGMHLALRALGMSGPAYLDGVFDKRRVTTAKSLHPPFVGTRWKLSEVPDCPGAWRLSCQNHAGFCLAADAPDVRLEVADPDHVLRPQQWLLYRHANGLMLRSRGGDWLGCKRGTPFCGPLDDLNTPLYHWQPEVYW